MGISIEHLGRRSIAYRVAAFASDSSMAAASGRFVHVYCDSGRFDLPCVYVEVDVFTKSSSVAQACFYSRHNYCSHTATAFTVADEQQQQLIWPADDFSFF